MSLYNKRPESKKRPSNDDTESPMKKKTKYDNSKVISDAANESLAYSPDGAYLAIGQTNIITLIETKTHRTVKTIPLQGEIDGRKFCKLDWSPNGKFLAVGTRTRRVYFIVETETWEIVKEHFVSQKWGDQDTYVRFSHDSNLLCVAGLFDTHEDLVQSKKAVMPSGRVPTKKMKLSSYVFLVRTSDWTPQAKMAPYENEEELIGPPRINEVSLSKNGLIAVATGEGIDIFITEGEEEAYAITWKSLGISHYLPHVPSSRVVTKRFFNRGLEDSLNVYCVKFRPDGKRLVMGTGGYENPHCGTINVSTRSWKKKTVRGGRSAEDVIHLAFSSDSKLLATVKTQCYSSDCKVEINDLETGKKVAEMAAKGITSLAFQPTTHNLAVGSYDGVRLISVFN